MLSSEKPILFNGAMVRAILEGRKTQTRRVVTGKQLDVINFFSDEDNNDRPGLFVGDASAHSGPGIYAFSENYPDEGSSLLCCPYGQPGDRLWVRETWGRLKGNGIRKVYRADADPPLRSDGSPVDGMRWTPSIHMPRWASRLTLEVTGVKVERLNDVTQADARAEGVVDTSAVWEIDGPLSDSDRCGPRGAFEALWESINGPDSWKANPWVWAVSFKRVTP